MVARLSSKDLLVQSLYELMREQPYEQITVRAIAANCGLSQRTFYNHFKDKHELVEWSYLHVLEEYYESHREHMTFTDWFRVSAQTVWDQRHALRKIIRYQGQNAMRLSWTSEEVDQRLHAIMKNIHANCVRHGEREGGAVNYVEGANIAGFVKLADAMLAQGLV